MSVAFVDALEHEGLGNHSHLAGSDGAAVVVDPPRDIDRVIGAAARRGVRISLVAETHLHNDYITGGLELARVCGAEYLVPAGAPVSFARTGAAEGDRFAVDGDGLVLRALETPGHTPHHVSYLLEEDGEAVAVFTGGSLLIGAVGRPDLVEPRLTERLARDQYASAQRLAGDLDDGVRVLPTHGFGSFCSSGQISDATTTIGTERRRNPALTKDADSFVTDLLAGLEDVPAYYTHMTPANAVGPAPVDLTPPRTAGPEQIAARLAAGEWVVDLRSRRAFARGHVPGTYNFEVDGKLATYLAWLIPWGKPVTLLAGTGDEIAAAQRELVRVGIDRPAAAATGRPHQWATPDRPPRSFPCGTFADLAAARRNGAERPVVLDVRRDSERARGHLTGSVHVPVHEVRDRLDEVPPGTVWVHCASGMRATTAASLLDAAGRDVVTVDDEPARAAEAGLPVTGQV